MNTVVRFPAYEFTDPRAGIGLEIEARKYGRVVRFDTILGRAYLERPEGTTWYPSPADVIPLRKRA